MNALAAVLACASILTAVPATLASSLPARDSRIVEVTVFRDRAEIVREAHVELQVGASTVEFAGMPSGVEPDSVRVSAEGVLATLGAVEIRERAEEPQETPELSAVNDEIRRIEREIAALSAAAKVDAELRTFLVSLRATVAATESAKAGEGHLDPAAIAALYGILKDKFGELSAGELARNDQQRALQEKLEVAKARLATLRPGPDIRSRVASVEIEASRAGSLTLRLTYVAPGASWRPSYRASLDVETGSVNLVSEGVVRQATGEDWSDVELRLSTASPASGVEPPMLTSWLLRPIEPVFGKASGGFVDLREGGRVYQNVLTDAPGVADAEREEPAQTVEADVVRSAYNVAFEVPGTSDVAADGRDHRVVLRTETLAGALVYRTVPALAPRAYLASETMAPQAYPLLAGPVRVFAGGAYLGSFTLEEHGPGTKLTLPFGIDNRIEVVRVPQPREASREGLGGKTREIVYAYRTTVHNLRDQAVLVQLEDRVPVPEDERIDVQLGKETTAGWQPSERRPGVMLWPLELQPGEKREVVLAYTVRHPADLYLPLE